jgi:hypothetical protein
MAKAKNDEPEPEQLPVEDEKRLDHPFVAAKLRPKATPAEGEPTLQEGETTRVLLTGDDRTVLTEAYVPTTPNMFRINVNGQFFEHVGEAADSGTWIYAPTR